VPAVYTEQRSVYVILAYNYTDNEINFGDVTEQMSYIFVNTSLHHNTPTLSSSTLKLLVDVNSVSW